MVAQQKAQSEHQLSHPCTKFGRVSPLTQSYVCNVIKGYFQAAVLAMQRAALDAREFNLDTAPSSDQLHTLNARVRFTTSEPPFNFMTTCALNLPLIHLIQQWLHVLHTYDRAKYAYHASKRYSLSTL